MFRVGTRNYSSGWDLRRELLGCVTVGIALVSSPSLAQEAISHDEVVVTASRVPVETKKVGSSITVITSEQLEQRQTRLVSDVLRDVPGLAVSSSGGVGATTQVRIRGGRPAQNRTKHWSSLTELR